VDIKAANLERADLRDVHLEETSPFSTNLKRANLENVHLEKANLINTDLKGANLEGAYLRDANLKEAKNLIMNQLSMAKTLYKAEIDESLRSLLKKNSPALFEVPK